MIDGRVHLFFQTYGRGREDSICHAVSDDGLTFTPNPENPVFRPTGDWTLVVRSTLTSSWRGTGCSWRGVTRDRR